MRDDLDKTDLDQLAKKYFIDELGLPPESIPDAAYNLMGVFDVLLRIDERLKQPKPPQPL